MKINIKKILSGILVSSLASISNAYGEIESNCTLPIEDSSLIASIEERKKGNPHSSFVLTASNSHMLLAKGHRSHSSHRSHRSHRSSGGGGGSYYTPPKYTTPSPSHAPSNPTLPKRTTPSPKNTSSSSTTSRAYDLGEREIKEGMSGNDVTQLAVLLIMYNYLSKQETNYKDYSSSIKQAVMAFQKDAGLPVTGICDRETIKKLEGWGKVLVQKEEEEARIAGYQERPQQPFEPLVTTPTKKDFELGERILTVGCLGPDVDSLINLLKKHNFLSVSSKLDFYDLAVYEAVKKAQIHLKLESTGVADFSTISALQDLKEE